MSQDQPAFDCRRCGHCCQGEGGIVLTSRDRDRLAGHLGLGLDAFIAAHTTRKGEKYHLGVREDGYCIFFEDGCGVHPARPDICRAWPFFRGNLLDATSWELSLEYCAGINPGLPHEEFVRQGLASLKSQGVRHCDEPDAPHALRLDGIVKP
ncbi:MAG: YkgJ family cysteine cluster protein [Thermodesulfobacteriota bacterium]